MRTVHKFAVPLDDLDHAIELRGGGRIVHVGTQAGVTTVVTVWAEVYDTDAEHSTTLWVRVFGTGHPIPDVPDPYQHVGTTIAGPFVWHLYQRTSS